jgi:predicted DNA-binding protein with PD1-like motif
MIFTETREGRRFVGELSPGAPVCAGLRELMASYRISCGWFHGSGYVMAPVIRSVDAEGPSEPKQYGGHYMVSSLQAIVSQCNGETDLVVRCVLFGEDGSTLGGVLEEAISASLEITCQTFDDITMRRYDDPDTNLARWLDVSVNVAKSVEEPVQSGRLAMEAMPSRLLEPNEMPRLRIGDYLEHPRLGSCEVVKVVDDDRISIRMESGKVAQLHLGLLTLGPGRQSKGRKIYDVSIRRRGGLKYKGNSPEIITDKYAVSCAGCGWSETTPLTLSVFGPFFASSH